MSEQGDDHFLACPCHAIGTFQVEAVRTDNDDEWTDVSSEGGDSCDSYGRFIAMEEEMLAEQEMRYGAAHFCYDCCTFHEGDDEEDEEEAMERSLVEREVGERSHKTSATRIGEQQKVVEARRTRRALRGFSLDELKAQLDRTKHHIESIQKFTESFSSKADDSGKELLCKVNSLRVEQVLRQDCVALHQAIYEEIVRQLGHLISVSAANRS